MAGGSLQTKLNEGALSEKHARKVVQQVGKGLDVRAAL